MLINLNGWPGVGKLTVGRILTKKLGGRLLDNHTLLNVARALAEKGSREYYDLVRSVRSVAFDRITQLPTTDPVVLTNVVARGGTSGFLEENWQAVINLTKLRGCDLYSVTLTCSRQENARRILREDRSLLQKKRDPGFLANLMRERTLFDDGSTFSTSIDNTSLPPEECASRIHTWINNVQPIAVLPASPSDPRRGPA